MGEILGGKSSLVHFALLPKRSAARLVFQAACAGRFRPIKRGDALQFGTLQNRAWLGETGAHHLSTPILLLTIFGVLLLLMPSLSYHRRCLESDVAARNSTAARDTPRPIINLDMCLTGQWSSGNIGICRLCDRRCGTDGLVLALKQAQQKNTTFSGPTALRVTCVQPSLLVRRHARTPRR